MKKTVIGLAVAGLTLGGVIAPTAAQAGGCVPAISHSNSDNHLKQTIKLTHACPNIKVDILGVDSNNSEHIGPWITTLNATSSISIAYPRHWKNPIWADYIVTGDPNAYELSQWNS